MLAVVSIIRKVPILLKLSTEDIHVGTYVYIRARAARISVTT